MARGSTGGRVGTFLFFLLPLLFLPLPPPLLFLPLAPFLLPLLAGRRARQGRWSSGPAGELGARGALGGSGPAGLLSPGSSKPGAPVSSGWWPRTWGVGAGPSGWGRGVGRERRPGAGASAARTGAGGTGRGHRGRPGRTSPEGDDGGGGGGVAGKHGGGWERNPPPASILLDPRGYIDDRTTAEGVTSGGKRIKVTFWTAHPPRCSCFTVHSSDLESSAFSGIPVVLSTEDDLALLRVPICPLGDDGVACNNDHFVYQAAGDDENKRPPSLDLIPRAPGRVFVDEDAGLLRCRARARNMYFVAVLCWAYRVGQYKLHLYSSRTETWSTRLMCLASAEEKLLYTYYSKVIAIGGELGSMGWVDLWRGIVICDLLKEDSAELLYIPLPPPLVPRTLKGPPLYVRDIVVVEGYIKYFEMCRLHGGPDEGCWKAVPWERKDSWNDWKKDCVIEVSKDYPAAHITNPDDQQQEEAAETKEQLPTLKGFYSGYPAVNDRGLFTAGWFGVREKHSSRLKIYDRLRASEQPR
ncbi:uncharacterized protein [Miscanthus floridulus]|uniref:uncharacterized protein n=1 Tax=Miscanthus floridulus TaxID=154761 RepID=UPI00345AEF40